MTLVKSLTNLDFQSLFENAPGLYLVLLPDLTIAGASDDYLEATLTQRDQICGHEMFEVFPDNPDDTGATGVANLRASLNYVIQNLKEHTMAIQKYDIRKPDGSFEVRYWSPVNRPVLDDRGKLKYIIHRVADVSEFIQLKEDQDKYKAETQELKHQQVHWETEQFRRAQEIQAINKDLMREIERRKIAESKAVWMNSILQSTIESNRDVLMFSIDREFNFLALNSSFKQATFQAYGTDVHTGSNLRNIITDENDREKAITNCEKSLEGEYHVTIEEFGQLNRFYFETRYNPIVDEDNQIIGVTVFSTNVTDRIKAEEQIKNLNKELEAFSYSVSHDLRAPLRAINGYSTVLQEDHGPRLDDTGKKIVEIIRTNATRMGQLIDDLLKFSRLGRSELAKSSLNMDQFVQPIAQELIDQAGNGGRIKLDVGSMGGPANFDANLIRQVWTNLISNAIKYSSKKEESVIQLGHIDGSHERTYYVKDNGVGFDMTYADKLFGVFQRLHKAKEFEGTGVGLALCKRIIDKHGGRIWAESTVDVGSTFYFTLPV
ncbi:MAG: PAS domain-containing protein [Bacteroidetes bacterium]|nr:PAS domain-containing protein [Bacteroidota bacterium]